VPAVPLTVVVPLTCPPARLWVGDRAEIQRHLSLAVRKRVQIAELQKAIAAHKRAAGKVEAARKRLTQINPLLPAAAADLQGIADGGPFCN